MELTKKILDKLSEEFPEEIVHILPGLMNEARTKAGWHSYLQHTDVAQRLDNIVPGWSLHLIERWESDGKKFVSGELTINGVTRMNVGEGDHWKDAFSGLLKRCAMLFGVGRYLYDSKTVWTPYNEPEMKYNKYFVADLELLRKGDPTPTTLDKLKGKKGKNTTGKTINFDFLKVMRKLKKDLRAFTSDDKLYYGTLNEAGYKKSNDIKDHDMQKSIYRTLEGLLADLSPIEQTKSKIVKDFFEQFSDIRGDFVNAGKLSEFDSICKDSFGSINPNDIKKAQRQKILDTLIASL